MNKSACLAFLCLVALLGASLAANHQNEKVVRIHLSGQADADRVFGLVSKLGLDVWSEKRATGSVDVLVSPAAWANLAQQLTGLRYEIVIEDVQRLIDESVATNQVALQTASILDSSRKFDSGSFFNAYHPYSEIISFLNTMNATYPSLARLETIGNTVQGNPIVGIHISSGPMNNGTKKPLIVYNSLQHAREWISGGVTTYLIDQLLSGYGKVDSVTKMLSAVDFFIVPVVNVDGYLWTWETNGDRMWRKNRRPVGNGCFGIDINRNWDFQFRASSLSTACDETFAGTIPFSEPENTAIGRFLKANPAVAYIDFHSYSQLLMWPWAYSPNPPPSNRHVVALGTKMAQVIKSVHGTTFEYGQLYQTIYPAYGSSIDYALGVTGVPLAYGVELRDTGNYGFLLPPNQIVPSGEEIFAGVQTMVTYIAQNGISRSAL